MELERHTNEELSVEGIGKSSNARQESPLYPLVILMGIRGSYVLLGSEDRHPKMHLLSGSWAPNWPASCSILSSAIWDQGAAVIPPRPGTDPVEQSVHVPLAFSYLKLGVTRCDYIFPTLGYCSSPSLRESSKSTVRT